MLHASRLCRISDVLAMQLLGVEAVLIELRQTKNTMCALEGSGQLIEVGEIGLDDFDAARCERCGDGRGRVARDGTHGKGVRLLEQELDDG